MGSHLPERQKLVGIRGEVVLQKVLLCSLRDPERAASISQDFKELREQGGRPWKPEQRTRKCWRDVLALNKDEVMLEGRA